MNHPACFLLPVFLVAGSAVALDSPPASTPLDPSGITEHGSRVEFEWEEVDSATWYRLYIRKHGAWDWSTWQQGNSWVNTAWNFSAGSYEWWVQTWNSMGYGPWSEGATFQIGLDAPVLQSPTGTISRLRPWLEWVESEGASWYELYIRKHGQWDWSTWVTTPWWIPSEWTFGYGDYTWWVKPWSPIYCYTCSGPWSQPADFTITEETNTNGAIIVTVCGLSFANTFGSLDSEDNNTYLRDAFLAMNLGTQFTIRYLDWNRDAEQTEQAVTQLRSVLLQARQDADESDRKLIVAGHSWGTVLSYIALSLEPDLYCDLLITLSSPMGTYYAHTDTSVANLNLYPADQATIEYINRWLQTYGITAGPLPRPWSEQHVNYWAWGDPVSGPLVDYVPYAEDIKLDNGSDSNGGWTTRNSLTFVTWHAYTSLQTDSEIREDVRQRVMGLNSP